jgi:hypothetical protein
MLLLRAVMREKFYETFHSFHAFHRWRPSAYQFFAMTPPKKIPIEKICGPQESATYSLAKSRIIAITTIPSRWFPAEVVL